MRKKLKKQKKKLNCSSVIASKIKARSVFLFDAGRMNVYATNKKAVHMSTCVQFIYTHFMLIDFVIETKSLNESCRTAFCDVLFLNEEKKKL